nr:hypothetical protein [Streptococcus equi]
MTNKVEDKRERKIANAVKSGDWSGVNKLLSQAMDNLERKERYYGKTSLNATVTNEGRATELMDYILIILITPLNSYLSRSVMKPLQCPL